MPPSLEVLFTPADFAELPKRDLRQTTCVVFDVLRATSSIVTALANGATAVIPVAEIPDALAIRKQRPEVLLAGERHGLRIRADLTGGVDFDLDNSPREFTRERVAGRTIVITTTNGSRAIRASAGAREVLIGSFLNLRATADHLQAAPVSNLVIVCSGTFEQTAYEDVLGAGALADLVAPRYADADIADSARIARRIFLQHQSDLAGAMSQAKNGRRLLANPELAADVPYCLQRDVLPIVATLSGDAVVKPDH